MKNLQLFAFCSHCEDEKVIEIHKRSDDETVSSKAPSLSSEIAEKSFSIPNAAEDCDNVSIDLDLMRHIDDLNQMTKISNFDPENQPHQMVVNYAHVLSALEMTIKSMEAEKSVETEKRENTVADFHINLEQRKNQIELLWINYRSIFPEEYVHMWSSLEQGLSDYMIHLKKRQQLYMDCDKLRRQNAQLKYMLQELH